MGTDEEMIEINNRTRIIEKNKGKNYAELVKTLILHRKIIE